ncbi:hypothetical protein Tco_1415307 [Tanacetum coccineum]
MPLFPSPEPMVTCIDDLDFFKDFENEFSAIVYNDALTSKSDFSTEPTLCPQHIDEFDLKDDTSLFKYDEVEQNVLYFNDLFPFNIIYPDDLKLDKGNDDKKINMIRSLGGNENIQGSNNQLEGSHDNISKVFIMRSFVMELNVNIMAWNYLVNGMLFNLIKNLCQDMALPPIDQRHQYYRFDGLQYTKGDIADFQTRFPMLYMREVHKVQSVFTSRALRQLFDIRGLLAHKLILEFFSTLRFGEAVLNLDTARALQFQLARVRRRMSWREFILALGLHTTEEMQTAGFGYVSRGTHSLGCGWSSVMVMGLWCSLVRHEFQLGKARRSMTWRQFILALGLHTAKEMTENGFGAYWDPILRLCHMLIACSIARRSQVFGVVQFKEEAGCNDIWWSFFTRLAEHFGLLTEDRPQGLMMIVRDLPFIDMTKLVRLYSSTLQAPLPPPPTAKLAQTMAQRLARVEEDLHEIRGALGEQRHILDSMARNFSRFSTWTVVRLS